MALRQHQRQQRRRLAHILGRGHAVQNLQAPLYVLAVEQIRVPARGELVDVAYGVVAPEPVADVRLEGLHLQAPAEVLDPGRAHADARVLGYAGDRARGALPPTLSGRAAPA